MKIAKPKEPEMVIVIDHREGLPFTFASVASSIYPWRTVQGCLQTGDYSTPIIRHRESKCDIIVEAQTHHQIAIERKSLSDLYSTLGSHRGRFESEFERLREFGYAAVIIESPWPAILSPNDHLDWPTQLSPKSVFATLTAWSQRFGVHIHACPDRDFAEQLTFRLLERWTRDYREGKRHAT